MLRKAVCMLGLLIMFTMFSGCFQDSKATTEKKITNSYDKFIAILTDLEKNEKNTKRVAGKIQEGVYVTVGTEIKFYPLEYVLFTMTQTEKFKLADELDAASLITTNKAYLIFGEKALHFNELMAGKNFNTPNLTLASTVFSYNTLVKDVVTGKQINADGTEQSVPQNETLYNNLSIKIGYTIYSNNNLLKKVYSGENVLLKTITYDNNGNILTESSSTTDNVTTTTDYIMGPNNKIEKIYTSYSDLNIPVSYWKEEYTNNLLSFSKCYNGTDDALLIYWKYEYDTNSQLVKATLYNNINQITSYNTTEYNGTKIAKIKYYDSTGVFLSYKQYSYVNNLLDSIIFYKSDDTLISKIKI